MSSYKYSWYITAPGYRASGTDVEPVDALNRAGCAVLRGGWEATGVIERDGVVWRRLRWSAEGRVWVVKPSGEWVEMGPQEL